MMSVISLPAWRRTGFFVVLSFATVVLIDWLCHDQWLGVNLAVCLLAFGALAVIRHPRLVRQGTGQLSVGLLLVAALVQTWDAGVLAPLLGLGAIAMLMVQGRTGRLTDLVALPERLMMGTGAAVGKIVSDARLAVLWRRYHGTRSWLRYVLVWIAPVGVGALFFGMFLLANPVLADLGSTAIDHVLDWFRDFTLPGPLRILLWILVTGAAWCVLRARWPARACSETAPHIRPDRSAMVVRSLVVCNVLFLGQNLLDVAFLWGGAVLPNGMTFATYAHRGAYTLVATALLAGGFILAWFRPGCPAQSSPWARRLVTAWIVQNVLLLGATAWRLHLYVDAYGLSAWRCAAGIWMLLVAIGLALTAWRILHGLGNRWLVNENLWVVLITLMLAMPCDWAGVISAHNVRHCAELRTAEVPLDLAYLEELGPGCLPALEQLRDYGNDYNLAQRAGEAAARISALAVAQSQDWRGWTWRRASASPSPSPRGGMAPILP